MSAPTNQPTVVDIDEFKIVNAVKFARATKKIKDCTMTRAELETFIAEMEDDVSLFCSIVATIIQMDADDVAMLFPLPAQLTRMMTTPAEHGSVFIKHAMQFYAAYATSSLYSSTDTQLYEKILIAIGTCVIFHKMDIKFAAYNGRKCVFCGAGCVSEIKCLQCDAVRYCSKRCRQAGWKAGHAAECKKE